MAISRDRPISSGVFDTIFEDEWLVVVNKPAGIVVHPTYKNADGTLLDALRARHPGVALAVVGRLDKWTSGLVVVAKGAAAHAALQRTWPSAVKEYLAVVCGTVGESSCTIDAPLASDERDRRRRVVAAGGAASVTHVDRLDVAVSIGRSLVRCRPVTGRRHQIRVHLAARGWPVLGDALYGQAHDGLPRHALHAWRLSIVHPLAGTRQSMEAPLPGELLALLVESGLALTV